MVTVSSSVSATGVSSLPDKTHHRPERGLGLDVLQTALDDTRISADTIDGYHHPLAENFSIKYSSASSTELLPRQDQFDGATKLIGCPFDEPVYVLYESDTDIEAADDADFDSEWLGGRISELLRAGRVTAFR